MALPSNTLATYRLEVRRLLHDATGKFWSNSELNDYINDARYRVASDTGCLRRLITAYLSTGREQYAIGSVTGAVVTAAGAGYSSIAVAVTGDGAGATATATLAAGGSLTGGVVTAVSTATPGIGYLTPPAVSFGGPGTLAAATASLTLVGVATASLGTGYLPGDIITLSGGVFTRSATIRVLDLAPNQRWDVIDGGSYSTIAGTLFDTPPNRTGPVSATGGSGTGAAFFCYWGVGAIAVTASGTGYTSAPAVTLTGGSAYLAGTATASVSPLTGAGGLATITITNGGTGYTAASLVFTGDGTGAAATATVIPATTLDIMNISPIFGNLRGPLNYQPWTEFNAKMRTHPISPRRPGVWSRYGTSGGTAFLGPIPDQGYTTEFDTAVLPDVLVADTDLDVMQFPFTAPIAYYACWKAKLKQQAHGEGEAFLADYKRKIIEAQASVQMRRIPNPYAGYSGG